jgi:hypothetical protein
VKSYEPPWRRFAIRAMRRGEESWLTDDGEGCDESCDFTDWDAKRLVNYVEKESAQSHADNMREYARERGLRLRVVPVWETAPGLFVRRRHS